MVSLLVNGGDYARALEILRPLAEQGLAPAQNYLGIMYRDGRGVGRNDKEAVRWFKKAAQAGDMWARTNLAIMYLNGQGTEQNYPEAVELLHLAAGQGDSLAFYILGQLYVMGLGVQVDNVQAFYWLELAVLRARTDAWELRNKLREQLNPTQMAAAEHVAQKCKLRGFLGCTPLPNDPLLRVPPAMLRSGTSSLQEHSKEYQSTD